MKLQDILNEVVELMESKKLPLKGYTYKGVTMDISMIYMKKTHTKIGNEIARFNPKEKAIVITITDGKQSDVSKFEKLLMNKKNKKKFVSNLVSANQMNIISRDFITVFVEDEVGGLKKGIKDSKYFAYGWEQMCDEWDESYNVHHIMDVLSEAYENFENNDLKAIDYLKKYMFHPMNINYVTSAMDYKELLEVGFKGRANKDYSIVFYNSDNFIHIDDVDYMEDLQFFVKKGHFPKFVIKQDLKIIKAVGIADDTSFEEWIIETLSYSTTNSKKQYFIDKFENIGFKKSMYEPLMNKYFKGNSDI